MVPKTSLQPLEYARLAVDVATDRLASDVVMLDIREVSAFADFFVIVSADSARQLSNLAEEIEKALEDKGGTRHHREGSPQGGWMLLDFGDVVIHIFRTEMREFYDLEGAWKQAVEVVRFQ